MDSANKPDTALRACADATSPEACDNCEALKLLLAAARESVNGCAKKVAELAERLRRADALAPPEPGWQPIATAPKDGTTVLIARDMPPFGWILGHAQYHVISRLGGNWIARGFGLFGELGLADPTHWQPLPAPPRADALDAPRMEKSDESEVENVSTVRSALRREPPATGLPTPKTDVVDAPSEKERRPHD